MTEHSRSRVDLPAVKELSAIAAEHNPDRPAYGDGVDGPTVTWEEFDDASDRAANALREHVAQGDRVAFLCNGSVDHVTLWMGALKAGCVVSNLHTRASPETMRYCVDVLRPRVLVLDEAFSAFFEERVRDSVATDLSAVVAIGEPRAGYEVDAEAFVADQPATAPDVRTREEDVVCVQWTSGTTGRPKGWCHTNRTLWLKALQLETALSLDRGSRQPHVFTPSFAAWYSLVLPALSANASTYFLAEWDPETYLAAIEARELTNAVLVPTMYRELLDHEAFDDYDLSSLSTIGASGERLDATTLERLRENVCETVTNAYAATEVLGTFISNDELAGDRIESVGKPLSGTRIRVIEEGGPPDATKRPGEIGEIVVRAADCTVWAWGDTAKTEAVFEDGWWYSGDLGYVDEEGYLFLEGRKGHMITSKAMKVFPGPVEERLNAHLGVEGAAVIGVADEEYGEMVTAVVHRADPDLSADDLDEWCLESDQLARYERPREYRFVDEPLPRTATGKLDRSGLEAGPE